jgi:hypothetical protein
MMSSTWFVSRMVATGLLAVCLLAQQTSSQPQRSRPSPKPRQPLPTVVVPVDPSPSPDPEEYWACGLGTHQDKIGHHCHCVEMVEEIQTEHRDSCIKYTDRKAYEACMNQIPEFCDIVKNSDLKHPVHNCKRSCNKNAICKCADGPSCHLPPLSPVEDPDQN